MNPEYIIEKEQIRWINKRYGGTLRTDAEIEFTDDEEIANLDHVGAILRFK